MQLNQGQIDVLNTFATFVVDPNQTAMVVTGGAGTGKSTVISQIKAEMAKLNISLELAGLPPKNLYVTATTNKAVTVLKTSASNLQHATTVHALLALNINHGSSNHDTDTASTRLANDFYNVNSDVRIKVRDNVVLIDEFTYIDQKLYNTLEFLAKHCRTKFVFVGDKNQLMPVSHTYIPVLDWPNATTVTLTEIMRQESPELKELSESLRDLVETHTMPKPITANPNNLFVFDDLKLFKKDFADAYASLSAGESICHIAYTNTLAKSMGDLIHSGKGLNVGDVVIVNGFTQIGSSKLYAESEVVITQEVAHTRVVNNDDEAQTPIRLDGQIVSIRTLGNFSKEFHNLFVPYALSKITNIRYSEDVLKDMQYNFVDLRRQNSVTVHKSQGSTYDHVFVNIDSFEICKSDEDYRRLLYVACTRARKSLTVLMSN